MASFVVINIFTYIFFSDVSTKLEATSSVKDAKDEGELDDESKQNKDSQDSNLQNDDIIDNIAIWNWKAK